MLPFFGEIVHQDNYPAFRLQAIFIGKKGANVRSIKEACQTGDPADPNIELVDVDLPEPEREDQGRLSGSGDSGSSSSHRNHEDNSIGKNSKIAVQVTVCSNYELVFIQAVRMV